jgi:hypothetical protein
MAVKANSKFSALRDRVLNQTKLPEELVHVPEWDEGETKCVILVRSLTAKERAHLITRITAAQPGQRQAPGQVQINYERFAAEIVLMTARDPEDGELLFEPTDRDSLLNLGSGPLEKLAKTARVLSGIEEAAQADAEFPSEE